MPRHTKMLKRHGAVIAHSPGMQNRGDFFDQDG
jgi:hypothetical protein